MNQYDDIAVDDLDGILREIADMYGKEVAVGMSETYGGMEIYIPTIRSATRLARNRDIYADYTHPEGSLTIRELTKKYELTEKQVRSILRDMSTVSACDLDKMLKDE